MNAPSLPPSSGFHALGLEPVLLDALAHEGYTEPTPIQKQAIPPALEGRDVLGCAQTGTGKTAAFSLPMLQRLDSVAGDDPVLRALIVTPTRELAAQIGQSIASYGRGLDLYHTVIFGGVSEKPQIAELKRGVDIIVATPGRLLDLLKQRALTLDHIEFFVLDEADRMLDMGFLPDVKRLIAALPKKRQTLFFSATMPPDIQQLADRLLHDPAKVAVAPPSTTAERIEQHLYFVEGKRKVTLLAELLVRPEVTSCLVFTRTKHGANRLVAQLEKVGIEAAAIHGNKSQNARDRAMNGFRAGTLKVLVATDIAARGIDVDGLSHVINFDLPNVPETYVHRIGRTGRAGAAGLAISFCSQEERPYLADIEKLTRVKLERRVDEGAANAPEAPEVEDNRGPLPRGGPGRNAGRGGQGRSAGRGAGPTKQAKPGARPQAEAKARPKPSHEAAKPSHGATKPSHEAAKPSHEGAKPSHAKHDGSRGPQRSDARNESSERRNDGPRDARGARPQGPRTDGQRSEGRPARPQGRPEGQRADGQRVDGQRGQRNDAPRGESRHGRPVIEHRRTR